MPPKTTPPLRFGIKRPFLWTLVAFGGVFVVMGLILMSEVGLSVSVLAVGLIGLAVAYLPYRLLAREAMIEIDAAAGVVRLLPGGEATTAADLVKINFNKITRGLNLTIDDPTWAKRTSLMLRYPMLINVSLSGYRINTRLLADGAGFIAAMQAFGALASARDKGEA